MLFMFIVPKNPGALQPWHWLIFALVPALAAVSFLAAPDMADRRMRVLAAGAKPVPSAPAGSERWGLTGSALFLSIVIGRTLLILALMGARCNWPIGRYLGSGHSGAKNLSFAPQMVAFAVIFGSMPGEMMGMRSLRVLPLSAVRLAALLLTVPLVLGFACAAFLCATGRMAEPAGFGPLAFLAGALVIGGGGALALAISLHIVSGAHPRADARRRHPELRDHVCPGAPAAIPSRGSACLVLAFFLLVRGLRKSNAVYQPRSIFGVNIGQPLSGR